MVGRQLTSKATGPKPEETVRWLRSANRGIPDRHRCGTGRVLLPIARAGIAVHGVDGSPAMLEELGRKLGREEDQVRERVRVSAGDLRSFRAEPKYPLVTIPFRPLQHMYSVEDQIAALRTAAFHLTSCL